jgi:SAM-dependent methyltransferase
MTREEYNILSDAHVQQVIADMRDRDPLSIALDKRISAAALVATQVKYLQRARTKLPNYYAAQCILTPRAFEQASSEECAQHKMLHGERVLDLCCGLGVDSLALSRNFREVIALEQDALLCEITTHNLQRMGATNVTVVCSSAETYLHDCFEHFDWVYADPDRRGNTGRKLIRLEECSPNILALLPDIRRCATNLCLKCSPLFDVDEALRLFPDAHIEAISLGGECKELLIYDDHSGPRFTATALGMGSYSTSPHCRIADHQTIFDPTIYRYLFLPDVTLQKLRIVTTALHGVAEVWDNNGFGFAQHPILEVPGRNFILEQAEPFDAKRLRRNYGHLSAEIFKRDFPLSEDEIRKRTHLKAGNELHLAFTRIGDRLWSLFLHKE